MDCNVGLSLPNQPPFHFSFDFEIIMEVDKDMLKGLVSTLEVTMKQPDRIQWTILK
jgi:hypothetical protein